MGKQERVSQLLVGSHRGGEKRFISRKTERGKGNKTGLLHIKDVLLFNYRQPLFVLNLFSLFFLTLLLPTGKHNITG